MDKKALVLEFMKAIAPVMVQEGMKLQQRILDAGSNPENCTVGGMTITEAEAENAKIWATAFAEAWLKDGTKTLQ